MKQLVLICSFTLTILLAHGQTMKFGVKGGLNLSGVDAYSLDQGYLVDISYSSFQPKFNIGALAEFSESDTRWKVQVELLYQTTGASFENFFNQGEKALLFHQITIPALVKFRLFKGFQLIGGGYASSILNVTETVQGQRTNVTQSYNDLDAGIIGGAIYDFSNGFFIEARYALGIRNMMLNEVWTSSYYYYYNNEVINLGIGYKF